MKRGRREEGIGRLDLLLGQYKDKSVFLTGHTGFKGSWLSHILAGSGARLTGYALAPEGETSLFALCGLETRMNSVIGDIRNRERLWRVFEEAQPEIVIHLAAQPFVRESYRIPAETYEINVMGTVNLLECVRRAEGVKSVLNVTTDKVYRNEEWEWGYRETDPLGGFDPYSNSKSCSDLAAHCYAQSFLEEKGAAVSIVRAGNVIGGGDFSADRVIPDCVRAAAAEQIIEIRRPDSVRPYQHVLEPLFAYLSLAMGQYRDPALADCYNVGPGETDCVTTGRLADIFCREWGENAQWRQGEARGLHEANYLRLDSSRIRAALKWAPRWDIETAVRKTVEWSKSFYAGEDVKAVMNRQIAEYCKG
jgi:CDP-glucose 4,6-dehydratase